MPEKLNSPAIRNDRNNAMQNEAPRLLSRSPHPYHRQSLHSPPTPGSASSPAVHSPLRSGQGTDDEDLPELRSLHPRDSDSGTEADDEHFLKGLPAPRSRPHKGLRGTSEGSYSGTPSPLLSPAGLSDEIRAIQWQQKKSAESVRAQSEGELQDAAEKFRRKRDAELKRRAIEVLLLVVVGTIIFSRHDVRAVVLDWKKELYCHISIVACLLALCPLRLAYYHIYKVGTVGSTKNWLSSLIPAYFEPAPLLYPASLTIFVAALLSVSNPAVILPNIVLSLAALPPTLIPALDGSNDVNISHWLISCLPLFSSKFVSNSSDRIIELSWRFSPVESSVSPEVVTLLYPLHATLCVILHYLATTSLLSAELQLLSVALINILLLSSSPQATILKALLWGGGITLCITCGHVLSWGVTLARVPKWRFRRAGNLSRRTQASFGPPAASLPGLSWLKHSMPVDPSVVGSESEDDSQQPTLLRSSRLALDVSNIDGQAPNFGQDGSISAIEPRSGDRLSTNGAAVQESEPNPNKLRRNTLPNVGMQAFRSGQTKSSGRRKRATSSSMQSFFALTEGQATIRKWLYAIYVYLCVLLIILVGIRKYVGRYALGGHEPVGWALGYLFGGLPWFRMQVVTANLEGWICLPELDALRESESCHHGWVEHLRQSTFSPSNTRLILSAYWLTIIVFGLGIVFRLSAVYEVDTRRKVFHFMMVGMLLPATYIDPTFAALALSLVLAIFLLLDLFRASQLPPLSKPLAYFLTPYVDGRDLRGPIVVSHIFLLIGCAIPLWLSLGTLPRTGTGCAAGWEVPQRDVSMVSGVVCVGLGDAAASLIGRRYGRHKWFWAGGKSIEGSLAFATAVGLALLLAKGWLIVGGWPTAEQDDWGITIWKTGVAAGAASLTEAVLTGGNDNVVVPVVLWLCVKGLHI